MVSVLFATRDSVYKSIPGCDVYDEDRNALTWQGGCPIVAHPPCRLWGRLRTFAKAEDPEAEKNLARFAVHMVRQWGGVLEHPASSRLFVEMAMSRPGIRDRFNGWTLVVPQWWWGHLARKDTWLYIIGCEPADVPELPFKLGEPPCVIQTRNSASRKHVPKRDRERTPRNFAEWLVNIASRCVPPHMGPPDRSQDSLRGRLQPNGVEKRP